MFRKNAFKKALFCAVAMTVGVGAFMSGGIAAPASYRAVTYDAATNKVSVNPSKEARSKSPDATSKLWDIYEHGLITDQVMCLKDSLSQWHEYKILGHSKSGNIVFHETFNKKFPARVAQMEFSIFALTGQNPQPAQASDAAKKPLEYSHVVYVFRSRDLVQVTYDPKGSMVRCGVMQLDGANSFFENAKEVEQNLSKYGIPSTLPATAKSVAVNRVMHDGLDQVDFIPKPNKAELEQVFLIHQYDIARTFEVLSFDSNNKLLTRSWCKFPARPIDGEIAKYIRSK